MRSNVLWNHPFTDTRTFSSETCFWSYHSPYTHVIITQAQAHGGSQGSCNVILTTPHGKKIAHVCTRIHPYVTCYYSPEIMTSPTQMIGNQQPPVVKQVIFPPPSEIPHGSRLPSVKRDEGSNSQLKVGWSVLAGRLSTETLHNTQQLASATSHRNKHHLISCSLFSYYHHETQRTSRLEILPSTSSNFSSAYLTI